MLQQGNVRYNGQEKLKVHQIVNDMDDFDKNFNFDPKIPGLQRFLDYRQAVIGNNMKRDETRDSSTFL